MFAYLLTYLLTYKNLIGEFSQCLTAVKRTDRQHAFPGLP